MEASDYKIQDKQSSQKRKINDWQEAGQQSKSRLFPWIPHPYRTSVTRWDSVHEGLLEEICLQSQGLYCLNNEHNLGKTYYCEKPPVQTILFSGKHTTPRNRKL